MKIGDQLFIGSQNDIYTSLINCKERYKNRLFRRLLKIGSDNKIEKIISKKENKHLIPLAVKEAEKRNSGELNLDIIKYIPKRKAYPFVKRVMEKADRYDLQTLFTRVTHPKLRKEIIPLLEGNFYHLFENCDDKHPEQKEMILNKIFDSGDGFNIYGLMSMEDSTPEYPKLINHVLDRKDVPPVYIKLCLDKVKENTPELYRELESQRQGFTILTKEE